MCQRIVSMRADDVSVARCCLDERMLFFIGVSVATDALGMALEYGSSSGAHYDSSCASDDRRGPFSQPPPAPITSRLSFVEL